MDGNDQILVDDDDNGYDQIMVDDDDDSDVNDYHLNDDIIISPIIIAYHTDQLVLSWSLRYYSR
jgi:hypothetical protein